MGNGIVDNLLYVEATRNQKLKILLEKLGIWVFGLVWLLLPLGLMLPWVLLLSTSKARVLVVLEAIGAVRVVRGSCLLLSLDRQTQKIGQLGVLGHRDPLA